MLLEQMSSSLNLPSSFILGWGAKAEHAYKEYSIPKRTHGWRTVHHPAKPLKLLQRWLLSNVIVQWPVHPAAFAYRIGSGIRRHAQVHAHNRFLLRLDLEDFFPSITYDDVVRFLARALPYVGSWTDSDRRLFCALVCRGDRLTIGAPSSPALSNCLLFELDTHIDGAATLAGSSYTRYADDLYFSASDPDRLRPLQATVEGLVADCDLPQALRINTAKTRHLSKKRRRTVTGLVIGSRGEVTIGRKRKRYLRGQVHRLDHLSSDERRSLAGLLAFVRDVEPDFINALVLKYGQQRVRSAMRGAS